MVFLDDLKDLVLYKKPFVLPINEKNIKKGSAIYLISPNLSTSTKVMNAPYLVNKMSIYQSYYLEKNANYYINKEGFLQDVDDADEFLCEVGEDDVLLAPAKKLEDEEVQNMELYFLSDKYMDGVKLEPRVPDNELTRNGYEDNTTPRTPFCTTIEGCLASFGKNVSGKQFYVYQPEEEELEVWEPNERACPDAKVTGEKWVLKQVQLKCIGKIKCLSTEENTTSVYTYGNQHSNSFNWNFKWVEKEGVPVQESVGPLEEKLFQDFRDYIKGKKKFENVQPLSSPIIHEANKKKETWLLLATYYGEFNKKNTSQFLTELQKNVKYYGVEVEFHTCYLPGDIFIFAKIPKDSMSESAIFNEANSRDQQKYQSNFKKKKTDKKFKYLSIKSPEALPYLEKDKFCKSISKSFKDYNGEIAVEGDNVAGYVFIGDKVDKGFIHSLRVYPPYRGCGVGGKLLNDAITKYGGYDLTVDKDNELAIDIYKRKGFAIDNSRNAGKKMHYMVLKPHQNESAVQEATRSELPESEFGVPSKRKFPLDSAQHVKSAIRFFNYVEPEDEAELAKRIKKKAKEFGVPIRCGKKNRLSKYISKEYVNEFMAASAIGNDAYAVINGSIKQSAYQNGFQYTEDDEYPYTKKKKAKIHKNNMMKNDFTEE